MTIHQHAVVIETLKRKSLLLPSDPRRKPEHSLEGVTLVLIPQVSALCRAE